MLKPIKPDRLLTKISDLFAQSQPQLERCDARAPLFPPNLGAQKPLSILIAEDNSVNQLVRRWTARDKTNRLAQKSLAQR